nr:winged helix-turn-helix domain-containing protein [Methylobacterium soli]
MTYRDSSLPPLSTEDVAPLVATVAGSVLLAGEAGYDDERAVWNLNHELVPAVIVVPESAADVRAAVAFAAGQYRPVLVKTTGHQIVGQAQYRFGEWRLHTQTRQITNPDGNAVVLTKGEYALLLAFVSAPQRPLTREHLLQATRVHEDVFDRSIDVQILRLRRKLEPNPGLPRIILTERGGGYVFALPVKFA